MTKHLKLRIKIRIHYVKWRMFYLYKLYRITLIFAIQQPTSTNANMNIAQPYLLIKNQSCKHHSIFAKLLYLEQKKIMQHSMFKMMVNVE